MTKNASFWLYGFGTKNIAYLDLVSNKYNEFSIFGASSVLGLIKVEDDKIIIAHDEGFWLCSISTQTMLITGELIGSKKVLKIIKIKHTNLVASAASATKTITTHSIYTMKTNSVYVHNKILPASLLHIEFSGMLVYGGENSLGLSMLDYTNSVNSDNILQPVSASTTGIFTIVFGRLKHQLIYATLSGQCFEGNFVTFQAIKDHVITTEGIIQVEMVADSNVGIISTNEEEKIIFYDFEKSKKLMEKSTGQIVLGFGYNPLTAELIYLTNGRDLNIEKLESTTICTDPDCTLCGFKNEQCLICGNEKNVENGICVSECSGGKYLNTYLKQCLIDQCLAPKVYNYDTQLCVPCPAPTVYDDKTQSCIKTFPSSTSCFTNDCKNCQKDAKICEDQNIKEDKARYKKLGEVQQKIEKFGFPLVMILAIILLFFGNSIGQHIFNFLAKFLVLSRLRFLNIEFGEIFESYSQGLASSEYTKPETRNSNSLGNKFSQLNVPIHPQFDLIVKIILHLVIWLICQILPFFYTKNYKNKSFCRFVFYMKRLRFAIYNSTFADFSFFLTKIAAYQEFNWDYTILYFCLAFVLPLLQHNYIAHFYSFIKRLSSNSVKEIKTIDKKKKAKVDKKELQIDPEATLLMLKHDNSSFRKFVIKSLTKKERKKLGFARYFCITTQISLQLLSIFIVTLQQLPQMCIVLLVISQIFLIIFYLIVTKDIRKILLFEEIVFSINLMLMMILSELFCISSKISSIKQKMLIWVFGASFLVQFGIMITKVVIGVIQIFSEASSKKEKELPFVPKKINKDVKDSMIKDLVNDNSVLNNSINQDLGENFEKFDKCSKGVSKNKVFPELSTKHVDGSKKLLVSKIKENPGDNIINKNASMEFEENSPDKKKIEEVIGNFLIDVEIMKGNNEKSKDEWEF